MKFRNRLAALIAGVALALSVGVVAPMAANAAPESPCGGTQRISTQKAGGSYYVQNCFSTTKRLRATVTGGSFGQNASIKCTSVVPGGTILVISSVPASKAIYKWYWC